MKTNFSVTTISVLGAMALAACGRAGTVTATTLGGGGGDPDKYCLSEKTFEATCQIEGVDSNIQVVSYSIKRIDGGICSALPAGYDAIVRTYLTVALEREGHQKPSDRNYSFQAFKTLTVDEINPQTKRVSVNYLSQLQRNSSGSMTKNQLEIHSLDINPDGKYANTIALSYKHHGLLGAFKSFEMRKDLNCK